MASIYANTIASLFKQTPMPQEGRTYSKSQVIGIWLPGQSASPFLCALRQ